VNAVVDLILFLLRAIGLVRRIVIAIEQVRVLVDFSVGVALVYVTARLASASMLLWSVSRIITLCAVVMARLTVTPAVLYLAA
jgi:multisubunit Na+/H+ antiporter MnhE subunit